MKNPRSSDLDARATKTIPDWTEEQISLLFKLDDAKVMRVTGFRRKHVSEKRRELGIASPRARNSGRVWSSEEIAMLGMKLDSAISELTGWSRMEVMAKRHELGIPSARSAWHVWTDEAIAMLGKYPDAEVARRLGINNSRVVRKRNELCIAPRRDTRKREREAQIAEKRARNDSTGTRVRLDIHSTDALFRAFAGGAT
jgi:hypothetical protein